MSLIGNITWINQNTQISSIVIAENVARDVVSKEVQKVLEEEKELKVKSVFSLPLSSLSTSSVFEVKRKSKAILINFRKYRF